MWALQWMGDHKVMTLITSEWNAHPSLWEKGEYTAQCTLHADFTITSCGTPFENIIYLYCDVPGTITMSRAWGSLKHVYIFLHIKHEIKSLLFGKYQHRKSTMQSGFEIKKNNNNQTSAVICNGSFLLKEQSLCVYCSLIDNNLVGALSTKRWI